MLYDSTEAAFPYTAQSDFLHCKASSCSTAVKITGFTDVAPAVQEATAPATTTASDCSCYLLSCPLLHPRRMLSRLHRTRYGRLKAKSTLDMCPPPADVPGRERPCLEPHRAEKLSLSNTALSGTAPSCLSPCPTLPVALCLRAAVIRLSRPADCSWWARARVRKLAPWLVRAASW